jgi:hypothetical protein
VSQVATTGAVAAAAVANAIRASGMVVRIDPGELAKLLARSEDPLVVYAPPRGLFASKHSYLLAYRGLAFYAISAAPLDLGSAEVVLARSIWAPH